MVIFKGPSWGPLHRSLRAFSLAINGHSGYLGPSFRCECGLSSGLRLPSVYGRPLYRLSTVFPGVAFHSAPGAFVVRFPFIDNLLIDALVGLCPHLVFNFPRRCYRPFFLHLSFPSLSLLLIPFFNSGVFFFYTLCGYRWLPILELSFLASCRAGGTAPSKILPFFEIFFCSSYSPDCFQPFPIVDIFSV